jgi:Domain of unknown function (DUF4157)
VRIDPDALDPWEGLMKRHAAPTNLQQRKNLQAPTTPAAAIAPPAYGIAFVDRAAVRSAPDASEGSAVVQRRPLDESAHAGPARAESRGGLPEPLRAGIESLAGVDLAGVRVHVNSDKPALIRARAYAQGNDIHLAPGQERHLPHEAWHLVQQRQGRVRPTTHAHGVSINDDAALEQDAESMGANAARAGGGRSTDTFAAPSPRALGSAASVAAGAGMAVVQGYFEEGYLTGTWLQSDDLTVATEKGYPNHKLYAKAGKAAAANTKLAAVNSGIELVETATSAKFWEGSRMAPTRQADLKKVEARNKQNGTSGDNMLLYADCGRSDAVVVGGADRQAVFDKPGGVPKSKAPGSPVAMKTAIMKAWLEHEQVGNVDILLSLLTAQLKEPDLVALEKEYAAATTEPKKKDVIARYQAKLDEIAEAYWAYYNKQSESERDKIDKLLKINRYAAPDVGQGYTISSGGPSAGKATWNFHWGGVVMTSDDGKDKVVMENYAVGDPKVENKLWTFDVYGTEKKGQTFHERHSATQQHGKTPTTMLIEKKP